MVILMDGHERSMETAESRLRDLAESTKYKKHFEQIKNAIRASEEIDGRIYTHWSGKRSEVHFIESVDHEDGLIWRGGKKPLRLKEVRSLLKKGNLNNHYLTIPDIYSDFKTKYTLEYFFDPGRTYPQTFDPFYDNPVYVNSAADARIFSPYVGDPGKDPDATKILMYIDITYAFSVLQKMIMNELRYLKMIWELKQKRALSRWPNLLRSQKAYGKRDEEGRRNFQTIVPRIQKFQLNERLCYESGRGSKTVSLWSMEDLQKNCEINEKGWIKAKVMDS